IVVGVLFISATVATSVSQVILAPILGTPDFLVNVSENHSQVMLGIVLELVDAFAVVAIAIAMYPLANNYHGGLAIGYVGFRVIEATIFITASVSLLSLSTLSQEYTLSDSAESSIFENSGILLIAAHEWAYLLMLIAFCLGALIFYYLLYQSSLIPHALSAWGFVAAAMALVTCLLQLFGVIADGSTISNTLFLPIALQEMVMAFWLIIKGFNFTSISSESSHSP
ncbi:MAG: DUF4386 domain-containing protein, partial [Cyclobacteriaceae bacterium]